MPSKRSGAASAGSASQDAQKLIVNESGAFAAPASLETLQHSSLLSDSNEASSYFDDDPSWRDSVSDVPVQSRAPSASPPRQASPLPRQPIGRTQTKPAAPPARERDSRRSGGAKAYLYVAVIALSLLGVMVLGVVMMPQMAGYFWKDFDNFAFINGELLRYDADVVATYKQYRAYMDRDVIYPGIFIDGIHVGDMTMEQAREAVGETQLDAQNAFDVTVVIGNLSRTINPSNVPAQRNLGNVLERAYAIGRTNTSALQTSTPFRERLDTALNLRTSGVNLTTTASYDHDAVRAIVDEIAAYVTRDPVDAQILSFDYNTRTFSFTDSQPGVTLDADLLYERVTEALDRWESGVTVTVDPIVTEPLITKEFLAKNFTLVAAYTTTTTSDSDRNTNIDLACKAINGTALLPGETFSFNDTTGQRTTDKGYKSAGAISGGKSIDEVGGGICQVSSTLFNAVAGANLEIVERSPHAWPSTYVNIGEDATVNWPNLDFKFKNNTDSPIFIITYYDNRKMSAEIWGMSLGEGVTIDLESTVVRTIDPPVEVKYVQNSSLPYGTSEVTVKSRTGYVVDTYKVWKLNGQETSRELLHTSTYKAYQQVVEYN